MDEEGEQVVTYTPSSLLVQTRGRVMYESPKCWKESRILEYLSRCWVHQWKKNKMKKLDPRRLSSEKRTTYLWVEGSFSNEKTTRTLQSWIIWIIRWKQLVILIIKEWIKTCWMGWGNPVKEVTSRMMWGWTNFHRENNFNWYVYAQNMFMLINLLV